MFLCLFVVLTMSRRFVVGLSVFVCFCGFGYVSRVCCGFESFGLFLCFWLCLEGLLWVRVFLCVLVVLAMSRRFVVGWGVFVFCWFWLCLEGLLWV